MMIVNNLYKSKNIQSQEIKNISTESKKKREEYQPPKVKMEIKSEEEDAPRREAPKRVVKQKQVHVKPEPKSDDERQEDGRDEDVGEPIENTKKRKNGDKKETKAKKIKKEKKEEVEDDDEVYVVESILDSRVNKKTKQNEYFIKWEGWTDKWNEWIPESQCSCDSLIKAFHSNKKEKQGKK
jgi:hypothetical protein